MNENVRRSVGDERDDVVQLVIGAVSARRSERSRIIVQVSDSANSQQRSIGSFAVILTAGRRCHACSVYINSAELRARLKSERNANRHVDPERRVAGVDRICSVDREVVTGGLLSTEQQDDGIVPG